MGPLIGWLDEMGVLGIIQTDVELVTTKPGLKNIEASRK